jgi:WXG100 family type VII secretion target
VGSLSGFEVQTAELLAARSLVSDAASSGRAELGRLTASAQDVLGYGWQGAAAAAFGHGWEQWHDGAQRVLAALDEIGVALGATARTYATHEAANVERLAS